MSDRITRPTVRLAGGLPDGNLSDLETHTRNLLSGDPDPVYALVLLTRARLVEDDDNGGAATAVMKVRALESGAVLPAAAVPGMTFRELMEIMRGDRTGVDQLPIDSDEQQTDAERMRGELRQWATGEGLSDDDMGRAWKTYFEGHGLGDPGSWLDADPVHAREFIAAMLEAIDGRQDPDAIAVEQSEAEHSANAANADTAEYDDPSGDDPETDPAGSGDQHGRPDEAGHAAPALAAPAATFSETTTSALPPTAPRAGRGRAALAAVTSPPER